MFYAGKSDFHQRPRPLPHTWYRPGWGPSGHAGYQTLPATLRSATTPRLCTRQLLGHTGLQTAPSGEWVGGMPPRSCENSELSPVTHSVCRDNHEAGVGEIECHALGARHPALAAK